MESVAHSTSLAFHISFALEASTSSHHRCRHIVVAASFSLTAQILQNYKLNSKASNIAWRRGTPKTESSQATAAAVNAAIMVSAAVSTAE